MNRYLPMIGCILCLVLAGCNSRQKLVSKRALLKYVNDPGHSLVQEQTVQDLRTRVIYQPSGLLVTQEMTSLGKNDTGTIHALEKKYAGNYYFLLQFSRNNKEAIRQVGSFSQYSDMVQVLSFQMQQFVNMTVPAHDTISMSDYVFEQTYGMSNANTLLLAFPRDKIGKADVMDVNIAECGFGVGSLKFSFRRKDIDKIPMLDYSRPD